MCTLKNLNYKYYFIYMIKNLVNKKCYVGFHATDKEYDEDDYFGSSKTLDNAIKKYGIEKFVMGILEYINVETWKEKERFWIKKMCAHVSLGGYNLTWGGDGILGYKHTDKSKIKMREKRLKYFENHVNVKKGTKLSEKTIKQCSESRLKNYHIYKTLEFSQNMSKSQSGIKNPMYGKIQSEKTKEKMKIAWAQRKIKNLQLVEF